MAQNKKDPDLLASGMKAGDNHYKAYVGPPENYDIGGFTQFSLLVNLGMRQQHNLLDVGCGSLRGGKLFLAYLLPKHYCGIEPNEWLVKEGIENEIGNDMVQIKEPVFVYDDNFALSAFDRNFDFIMAQSIFSHASVSQIKLCLGEAKKVLTESGIFAASYVQGKENYEGEDWVYPGLVTYTPEYMESLAVEQGLVCKHLKWNHPNRQTWVAYVHPGTEDRIPDLGNENYLRELEDERDWYREKYRKIKRRTERTLLTRLKRKVFKVEQGRAHGRTI